MPEKRKVSFDEWIYGVRDGRSYVGDGRSHLFNFRVNRYGVGERVKQGKPSYQAIEKGDTISVSVNAAALLDQLEDSDIRSRPYGQKPYWHIERARKPGTRLIPVELIVNGQVVQTKEILGNGETHPLTFDYLPTESSWVAIRILGACHTNPIFVILDRKPIRASRTSAEWCIEAVEVCWNAKKGQISTEEIGAAKKAWDHARNTYKQILRETD